MLFFEIWEYSPIPAFRIDSGEVWGPYFENESGSEGWMIQPVR